MTQILTRLPEPGAYYEKRWAADLISKLHLIFEEIRFGNTELLGELIGLSGRRIKVTSVTDATYTLLLTDDVIDVNRAGPVTLTLPEGASRGKRFYIQDSSGAASSNPITVNKSASINVNGGSSVTLNTDYGRILVIYNGEQYVSG